MSANDNNPQELEIAPASTNKDRLAEIRAGSEGAKLMSLADYWTFATALVRAGMAPVLNPKTGERMTPAMVMIAMQAGAEVGLPPMASLKNIAVIHGRATLWGDSALALAFRKGLIESIEEWMEGEGDERVAFCRIKRKGMANPVTRSFSVADAKKAGLWGKAGPWVQYDARMLAMRARGFTLRDACPDALGGFMLAEEAQDMQVTAEVEESRTEALLANLKGEQPSRELPGEVPLFPPEKEESDE